MHFAADGCGDKTTVLRDLIEIRILKIAVEVGLVEGNCGHDTTRAGDFYNVFRIETTPFVFNPRK